MSDSHTLGTIAAVVLATDPDELLAKMQSCVRALECDQGLFGMRIERPLVGTVQHVASGYRPEYQRIYQDRHFITRDPTVTHCQSSTAPLVWNEGMYSPASFEIMEEARRFGLGHGLSVAVHESATAKSMLSLARDKPFEPGSPEERRLREGAAVLASALHVATQRLVMPALFAQLAPTLTAREKTCLHWVAQGKSDGVIADILHTSSSAVHFHVTNVLKKLQVSSRAQAVAKAVALGLLD
jgi:DNA-binding CsgD family transcriptional regulator